MTFQTVNKFECIVYNQYNHVAITRSVSCMFTGTGVIIITTHVHFSTHQRQNQLYFLVIYIVSCCAFLHLKNTTCIYVHKITLYLVFLNPFGVHCP